jgi:hypothetical protein
MRTSLQVRRTTRPGNRPRFLLQCTFAAAVLLVATDYLNTLHRIRMSIQAYFGDPFYAFIVIATVLVLGLYCWQKMREKRP